MNVAVGLVVALVGAGCSGSDSSSSTDATLPPITQPATTQAATTQPATTQPATTLPTTTQSVTTIAPTTIAPTTAPAVTTVSCPVLAHTDVQSDGFPGQLSGLVGADVRAGADACHERFVLELQGTGDFPGWWVRYEPGPLTNDPAGEPVEVAGNAYVVVTVESWMTNPDGEGYHGSDRITPANVSHIKELVMLGDFEGVTLWAIGLDEQRPFEVTTLDGPPRLVVDFATT